MKLLQLACLASAFVLAYPASATSSRAPASSAHAAELAAMGKLDDPFATVYILSSRKTWQSGLSVIGRSPMARRDGVGSDLVLSQVREHQLPDVSRFVHETEKRCGGYFAFRSQAEADTFLREDRTAFAMKANLVAYTVDNAATVSPWLPQVSQSNILATMSHLSTAYPNRYYTSSFGVTSANWIRDSWQALANGRSDVSTELFTACGNCGGQPSVILTIQGTELPSEIVVLGGHLDSISNSGSGEAMQAPGADDDASGISSLTEVLRIAMASGWKPKRTVKFMGYAAEESGLRGSAAIAKAFKTQGQNVVGVLQLDMTNYRTGSPVDMQLITDYSNAGLQQFLRDLFDTYLQPLGLSRGTYTCGYGCSDHASWTTNGFPSAMMYEGGDFPYLHTTSDTVAQMGNSALPSVALTKLGLAFLGELAKTQGIVTNTPPVANFNFSSNGLTASFSDTSTDSNGSIASRSWNFGDGATSTSTSPTHSYAAAGTYNVSLSVTDNGGAGDSITRAVAVSQAPAGGVLVNGVATAPLSATAGNAVNFTMQVPANSTALKFKIIGGTGNADLYVKFGSAPTDTVYDCRPFLSRNNETCTVPTAQAGTYYVRIKARTSFNNVRLTGSYSAGTGGGGGPIQSYTSTTIVPILDRKTVDSPVTVSGRTGNAPSNAQVAVNITHAKRGDLRIRLVAPDGSLYLLKASSPGDSAPNVVDTYTVNLSNEALNGTWKLRVVDSAIGNTGQINSWTLTF